MCCSSNTPPHRVDKALLEAITVIVGQQLPERAGALGRGSVPAA